MYYRDYTIYHIQDLAKITQIVDNIRLNVVQIL
jgi:hypothetical protein